MDRVRMALAEIKADRSRAQEVVERGLREAPEVFIPGLARYIAAATAGAVIDPQELD